MNKRSNMGAWKWWLGMHEVYRNIRRYPFNLECDVCIYHGNFYQLESNTSFWRSLNMFKDIYWWHTLEDIHWLMVGSCQRNICSELWVFHPTVKGKCDTMYRHHSWSRTQDCWHGSYLIEKIIVGKHMRILRQWLHSEMRVEWKNRGWWKKRLYEKKCQGGWLIRWN